MVTVQNKSFQRCEEIVRRSDRDRYYLYAACRGKRARDVLPLLAFNCEISKTRDVVSEPTLGLIRLQWWRDALDEIYGGGTVPAHEVLTPLTSVIERYGLPKEDFTALLNGRETEFENFPLLTVLDLARYLTHTTAPLNRMALTILGQAEDEKTLEALSAAYGFSGFLRALPHRLKADYGEIPQELLNKHGLKGQSPSPDAIQPVIVDLWGRAQDLIAVTPQSRFMRISQRLTRTYLSRIQKYEFDIFDPRLNNRPVGFLIRAMLNLM